MDDNLDVSELEDKLLEDVFLSSTEGPTDTQGRGNVGYGSDCIHDSAHGRENTVDIVMPSTSHSNDVSRASTPQYFRNFPEPDTIRLEPLPNLKMSEYDCNMSDGGNSFSSIMYTEQLYDSPNTLLQEFSTSTQEVTITFSAEPDIPPSTLQQSIHPIEQEDIADRSKSPSLPHSQQEFLTLNTSSKTTKLYDSYNTSTSSRSVAASKISKSRETGKSLLSGEGTKVTKSHKREQVGIDLLNCSDILDLTIAKDKKRRDLSPFFPKGIGHSTRSSTPIDLDFKSIDTPIESGDEDLLNQPTTSAVTACFVDTIIKSLDNKEDKDDVNDINLDDEKGNDVKVGDIGPYIEDSQPHSDMLYKQALRRELRCKIQVRQEFGEPVQTKSPKIFRSKSCSDALKSPKKDSIVSQLKRKERNKVHANNSRAKARNYKLTLEQMNRELEEKTQTLLKDYESLKSKYKMFKRVRDWLSTQVETIPRPANRGKLRKLSDFNDTVVRPNSKPQNISILSFPWTRSVSEPTPQIISRRGQGDKKSVTFLGEKSDAFSKRGMNVRPFTKNPKDPDEHTLKSPLQQDTNVQRKSSNDKTFRMKLVSNWLLDHNQVTKETETDGDKTGGRQLLTWLFDTNDSSADEVDIQHRSPWEVGGSRLEHDNHEKNSTSSKPSPSLTHRLIRPSVLDTESHPTLPFDTFKSQSTHQNKTNQDANPSQIQWNSPKDTLQVTNMFSPRILLKQSNFQLNKSLDTPTTPVLSSFTKYPSIQPTTLQNKPKVITRAFQIPSRPHPSLQHLTLHTKNSSPTEKTSSRPITTHTHLSHTLFSPYSTPTHPLHEKARGHDIVYDPSTEHIIPTTTEKDQESIINTSKPLVPEHKTPHTSRLNPQPTKLHTPSPTSHPNTPKTFTGPLSIFIPSHSLSLSPTNSTDREEDVLPHPFPFSPPPPIPPPYFVLHPYQRHLHPIHSPPSPTTSLSLPTFSSLHILSPQSMSPSRYLSSSDESVPFTNCKSLSDT